MGDDLGSALDPEQRRRQLTRGGLGGFGGGFGNADGPSLHVNRSAGTVMVRHYPNVLDEIASRERTDRASVALAFVLAHPARPIAIIGTQRPERIATSLEAARVTLDRADVYAIVQASEGRPLP